MEKKRITIEEADNGYTVSMYEPSKPSTSANEPIGPGKEHKILCKTVPECLSEVRKLLGDGEMEDTTESGRQQSAESFFKGSKKEE